MFSRIRRRLATRLANKHRKIRLEFEGLREKLAGSGARTSGVRPENMIWIFGTGRGGSTWLRNMMKEMEGYRIWEEPLIGRLFGQFYNETPKGHRDRAGFVLGEPTRKGWIRSMRNFVLDSAGYAQPALGPEGYLVIKEPNGSEGAPLLMEALPESRLIFLIRDPRDVMASVLDGARKGSWLYQQGERGAWKQDPLADERPDVFVKNRAHTYLRNVGSVKRAYDAHRGPKVLVRYEDLRADALGTMKRIYSTLGIPADEEKLARTVEKHSWENIPEKKKGAGKFYRKGAPGSWREDLTPEQAKMVETITAPLLKEFYPARAADSR